MTWGPVSVSDSTGPPQPADRARRHARCSRRRSEHEGQLHAEGHEYGQATEEGSEDQPAGAHRRFIRLPGTAAVPRIVPSGMITTMSGRTDRAGGSATPGSATGRPRCGIAGTVALLITVGLTLAAGCASEGGVENGISDPGSGGMDESAP